MVVRRLVLGVVALAVGLTALAGAPAQAASAVSVSLAGPSSATAGVPVTLTATLGNVGDVDPSGSVVDFMAGGQVFASSPVTMTNGLWASTASYVPSVSGKVSLSARFMTSTSAVLVMQVSPVATVTTVTAPSYAKLGTWQQVQVQVTASSGSLPPSGTVTVTATGGFREQVVVTAGSGASSTGAVNYFAGTPGNVSFTASFAPSGPQLASTSAPDVMAVNDSGAPVTLQMPGEITVGVPATVTVVSSATSTGFVTMKANGVTFVDQAYFTNGRYSVTTTPKVAGTYVLDVTVTSPQGQVYTGSDVATVTAATAPDSISLSVQGYGELSTTVPFNAANGSVFTLVAASASGAPVTVTSESPCLLNQLTLTIQTGSGYCTLVASSPGGNGRSAVTTGFPVQLTLGTQTASLPIKDSGKYKASSKVILGPVGAATNAGQTIKWKLTGGSSKCELVKSSGNWYVKLPSSSDKKCQVEGTAPEVEGAWKAYKVSRKYTVK